MLSKILILIVAGLGSETNVIGPYDNPGTCICDLTLFSCDRFCCCDTDCTASVINVWNTNCAVESYSTFGTVYCANSNEIYKINSRRGIEITNSANGQQCIKVDNSEMISRFHTLVSSVSASQIAGRISESTTYKNTLGYIPVTHSTTYSPGDAISGVVIFTSDSFGKCIQGSADFLTNIDSTTCSIIGNLNDLCNSYLNTAFYDSSNTQTSFSLNTCSSAVVGINYAIYTDSTQTKVSSVRRNFVLMDISSTSDVDISQTFSLNFYTTSSPVSRSGNPGYQLGKNINAFISGTASTFAFQGKSSIGACSNTTGTGNFMTYATNIIYSCYLNMTYQDLQNYCTSSLDITLENIFANHASFTKIGKWGTVSGSNNDD